MTDTESNRIINAIDAVNELILLKNELYSLLSLIGTDNHSNIHDDIYLIKQLIRKKEILLDSL